MILWNYQ